MFKKFTDGLTFGAGFAVSFIALWYPFTAFIMPAVTKSHLERLSKDYPHITQSQPEFSISEHQLYPEESQLPFHERNLDEQIKQSSVVALARYEPGSDGRVRAVIKEFLKKDPTTTIYYGIGDEYESASYYPEDNVNHGDGIVIFFTGSPATMKMSMTFSGERIRGLGDLPLELLREKCK